jgi:ribosomal protein L37E
MVEVKKLGRKVRGLVRRCERCGKRGQELFKIHTYPGPENEKVKFYCRRCYTKTLRSPKEKI